MCVCVSACVCVCVCVRVFLRAPSCMSKRTEERAIRAISAIRVIFQHSNERRGEERRGEKIQILNVK